MKLPEFEQEQHQVMPVTSLQAMQEQTGIQDPIEAHTVEILFQEQQLQVTC